MKLLIFGDVVAKIGRKTVANVLPAWRELHQPDLVLANVENLAHGIGATTKTLQDLLDAGVDFFTSGNHIWGKKEIITTLNDPHGKVIRPANYPEGTAGRGWQIIAAGNKTLLVINLLGKVFFKEGDTLDNPFRKLDAILYELADKADAIIVDMHAEATSEKIAMGWYADGRVSAVYGTHTHVPTADAHILPEGTAYITDIGMTGLYRSSLGANIDFVIDKFLDQKSEHQMWDTPENGLAVVNAVLIDVDVKTKRAVAITRLFEKINLA